MRVKTVKAITFGRQRLELRESHREVQVRLAFLQVLPQRGRLRDHVHGFRKDDSRLVPLRCHTVNFRAADRKSTRLNSSHVKISYAVFCLKKKKKDGRRADCNKAART